MDEENLTPQGEQGEDLESSPADDDTLDKALDAGEPSTEGVEERQGSACRPETIDAGEEADESDEKSLNAALQDHMNATDEDKQSDVDFAGEDDYPQDLLGGDAADVDAPIWFSSFERRGFYRVDPNTFSAPQGGLPGLQATAEWCEAGFRVVYSRDGLAARAANELVARVAGPVSSPDGPDGLTIVEAEKTAETQGIGLREFLALLKNSDVSKAIFRMQADDPTDVALLRDMRNELELFNAFDDELKARQCRFVISFDLKNDCQFAASYKEALGTERLAEVDWLETLLSDHASLRIVRNDELSAEVSKFRAEAAWTTEDGVLNSYLKAFFRRAKQELDDASNAADGESAYHKVWERKRSEFGEISRAFAKHGLQAPQNLDRVNEVFAADRPDKLRQTMLFLIAYYDKGVSYRAFRAFGRELMATFPATERHVEVRERTVVKDSGTEENDEPNAPQREEVYVEEPKSWTELWTEKFPAMCQEFGMEVGLQRTARGAPIIEMHSDLSSNVIRNQIERQYSSFLYDYANAVKAHRLLFSDDPDVAATVCPLLIRAMGFDAEYFGLGWFRGLLNDARDELVEYERALRERGGAFNVFLKRKRIRDLAGKLLRLFSSLLNAGHYGFLEDLLTKTVGDLQQYHQEDHLSQIVALVLWGLRDALQDNRALDLLMRLTGEAKPYTQSQIRYAILDTVHRSASNRYNLLAYFCALLKDSPENRRRSAATKIFAPTIVFGSLRKEIPAIPQAFDAKRMKASILSHMMDAGEIDTLILRQSLTLDYGQLARSQFGDLLFSLYAMTCDGMAPGWQDNQALTADIQERFYDLLVLRVRHLYRRWRDQMGDDNFYRYASELAALVDQNDREAMAEMHPDRQARYLQKQILHGINEASSLFPALLVSHWLFLIGGLTKEAYDDEERRQARRDFLDWLLATFDDSFLNILLDGFSRSMDLYQGIAQVAEKHNSRALYQMMEQKHHMTEQFGKYIAKRLLLRTAS